MEFDATCAIVLYKNDPEILKRAIESFLSTDLKVKLFLIDNSPDPGLKQLSSDPRIEYFHNPSNPGFGAAHNIAIRKSIGLNAKYHLVLNPDIFYDKGVMELILAFMKQKTDVGLVMPKVLYPNGNIQYLAKLLPSPWDFFIRRLLPFKWLKEKVNNKFELRFSGYNKIMDVPYLSGCFMVFRTDVLAAIKGFDERIFMHMEDLDISRRCIDAGYRNVFFPDCVVYHDHLFKSLGSFSNLKMYLTSAFYYFNKWGWFFDKNRKFVNRQAIYKINQGLGYKS